MALDDIAFRDPGRARAELERLGAALPKGILHRVHARLRHNPDPDAALRYLDRLLAEDAAAFHHLARNPFALQCLLTLFAQSQFLSEEVLQHPDWLELILVHGELNRGRSAGEYVYRLEQKAAADPLAFATFRREELLRICLRDTQGLATMGETTAEISHLADAILEVAFKRVREALVARYGAPRLEDGSFCGFSVIALGKLGGEELNYSSDIDLMFVFQGRGETDGAAPIGNQEFYKRLANEYTSLLSSYTAAGACYRVDLRLRPDGRLGEVVISLEAAKAYYADRARDWELQMLIKARIAAGERDPGRRLLEFVEPMIYNTTLDFKAVEAMSETRARINEKIKPKPGARKHATVDVKLAPGGIRDIEFLVQCLQRLHGGREPWVRHGGTQLALTRLRDKELLSPTEYSTLAAGYTFLRHLEHRLQFADDQQTHALPESAEALELLARRMPAPPLGAEMNGAGLRTRLQAHLDEVQAIYERVIHAQRPTYYTITPSPRVEEDMSAPAVVEPVASALVVSLDRPAPSLARLLMQGRPRRNVPAFEIFLEKIVTNESWIAWLNEDLTLAGYVLDLFENTPYLCDELNRSPEFLAELREMRHMPASPSTRVPRYEDAVPELGDPGALRLFYRREMFRILCESVCLRVPVFHTLKRTSALADAAIAAAYQMAVWHVQGSRPAASVGYLPSHQLMVIALGRLGVQEFDLGSDADLVFVLPNEDAEESQFWTRVAERIIEILAAYTGTGTVFAVDARLKPNGKEGPLVQTERAYLDYFAHSAEAWEGIAYLKARSVAGDGTRAVTFLDEVQQLDFRRWGQSGRSRHQLKEMRLRIEREQSKDNPLKAGRGSFYDVDFALMYLRLKSAGIFFKSLNTPERIDIIERMGHLERADARFLLDAASFYRAVDHGLRILDGHASGNLPHAPLRLAQLTDLVSRWTTDHLHDQPIPIELAQIQERTRDFFERLFG